MNCNLLQQRHISDNMVNNRLSEVLRDGQLVEAKWQTVVVGDIIKMKNGQFVAVNFYNRGIIITALIVLHLL